MEAADVGGPPGEAGEGDVEAGGELVAERGPGGGDVAAPDEGGVFLAAGPGAADEVDDGGLAGGELAAVEGGGVGAGVEVADAEGGAEVVAVVVEVVGGVFGCWW